LQHSSTASEALRLRQELATRLNTVEAVAESTKAAARESAEEIARLRVELSEAIAKARASEQRAMELRSIATSAKIQEERVEERLRHSEV